MSGIYILEANVHIISLVFHFETTKHLISPFPHVQLIQATHAHVQCSLAMAGRRHLPSTKAGTDFNITDDWHSDKAI